MQKITKEITVSNYGLSIIRTSCGIIKTKFGSFNIYYFKVPDQWKKYIVIANAVKYDKNNNPVFSSKKPFYLRIDSFCLTGQVFGDLQCDCREQLEKALGIIAKNEGLIISVPQDGRGMGTDFKLKTLFLQDSLQLDTVTAALSISNNSIIDNRTYYGAICILKFFDILITNKNLFLLSNNPDKLKELRLNKYKFRLIGLKANPTALTVQHLKAKQEYFQHINLIQ